MNFFFKNIILILCIFMYFIIIRFGMNSLYYYIYIEIFDLILLKFLRIFNILYFGSVMLKD